jgi:poly(hydroxyalkanoate) depolymerase family esterase
MDAVFPEGAMRPFFPLDAAASVSRARGAPLPPDLTEIDAFGANPGALRLFAYTPVGLAKNAPLVVILHGCGQTATEYARGAGWITLADELGFALLAPEQNRANNMNTCFNWFQPGDAARDQGEAASIAQMIAHMVQEYALDRGRIFITGLSAGGAMSAAMLAAYPELFAGGAIIAGLPVGSAANVSEALNSMRRAPVRAPKAWGDLVRRSSSHPGPWPRISIWHGGADFTVHDSNGEALALQWANVHDLPQKPSQIQNTGTYRRRAWKHKDGTVALEAFHLPVMGHGTPVGGAAPENYGQAGPFFLAAGVSSTAEIANFWGLRARKIAVMEKSMVPARVLEIVESFWTPAPEQPLAANEATAPASKPRIKDVIVAALKSAGLVKK